MDIRFLFDDNMDEISGFELGNIIISQGDLQCTSLNRKPDQSMMLFITIPHLLKQIRKMIENKEKQVIIEGVDSLYWIKIKKEKNLFIISDDKCLIKEIEQRDLLNAMYMEAKEIWNKYGQYIISDAVR